MKYAVLALFIIASAVHLYASLKKDKKLRAQSKVFLLLLLLGWYLLAARTVSVLMVLALFFSWLGDVLLIPDGKKWFVAGGVAFMVSHLFFVLFYSRNVDFSAIPGWAVAAAAIVYIAVTLLVFKGLRPHLPKALFYPMLAYLLINGTMNCFALYQLLSLPCAATVIAYIGAVLFFCSDSCLFYTRFKKDTRFKTHFAVMLTYLAGEFLIALGAAML